MRDMISTLTLFIDLFEHKQSGILKKNFIGNSFMRLVAMELVLYGALILTMSGCATMVTEGQLKPIAKSEAAAQIDKTVSLRYLNEVYRVERNGIAPSTSFSRSLETQDAMVKSFKKIVSAKNIEVVYFPLEQIDFDDRNHRIHEDLIERPVEQTSSDIFIDVHLKRASNSGDRWNVLLMPLSMISLGFIPYFTPAEFHFEATVYNKATKLTKKFAIDDQFTIWQWTPLVLAPGSYWAFNKSFVQEKMVISFENLFEKMNKEGAFL